MKIIFDPRYQVLIRELVQLREENGETQTSLSSKINKPQSYLGKIESFERRLDVIELLDILEALRVAPKLFFQRVGWIPRTDINKAIPIKASVESCFNGVVLNLVLNDSIHKVELENIKVDEYLRLEESISSLFTKLNSADNTLKNRDAIILALKLCFEQHPTVNPSDLYHQVVYRLYLREYYRTTPEQSWVRAGGEAIQLFCCERYNAILKPYGIAVLWLSNETLSVKALNEMGLYGKVGNSKLDLALYGTLNNQPVLFGGIHVKASLAERVTDDIPCSEAMMEAGYLSCLFTFDAKSFPPPKGDLVNRGEFGSPESPSDKRLYIEKHGSFSGCFSYNLKTIPSLKKTESGRGIFVSKLDDTDSMPLFILNFWKAFKKLKKA